MSYRGFLPMTGKELGAIVNKLASIALTSSNHPPRAPKASIRRGQHSKTAVQGFVMSRRIGPGKILLHAAALKLSPNIAVSVKRARFG